LLDVRLHDLASSSRKKSSARAKRFSRRAHSEQTRPEKRSKSMPPVSEAENAPGFEFSQLQRSVGAAHGSAAAASCDLLQRFVITRGGHTKRAFEHLARSGKHAGLYGHVSLGLFECHTITYY
jgi:hypothetical protein